MERETKKYRCVTIILFLIVKVVSDLPSHGYNRFQLILSLFKTYRKQLDQANTDIDAVITGLNFADLVYDEGQN